MSSSNSTPVTTADLDALKSEINTFYLFWAGVLVFTMQLGFAMLSAGAVRMRNVQNIMLKGLLDACIGAILWYFLGYGFAFDADVGVDGHKGNPFIGNGKRNFALSGQVQYGQGAYGTDWVNWFFQYAFAAAAATIVSGAVAERCQLTAYLIYTACITGFIYPVVVHWVWDPVGYLSAVNKNLGDKWLCGMIDFAGSGVVHMTGGVAALVGAKVLGPRSGRFTATDSSAKQAMSGHSMPLTVIGTFLLWIGWYGFNQGSTFGVTGQGAGAARVGVTTTLSPAAAGVCGLYIKSMLPAKFGGTGIWDLSHTCNSILAGLVAITAGCSTCEPYAAVITGIIAAFVYHGASCAMRKLQIDDPLDAFAVHGANGFLGLVLVGFFTTEDYSYATNDTGAKEYGIFYGGGGVLLATQIAGGIMIIIWTLSTSIPLFVLLKYSGIFRVPLHIEEAGLDESKHGGSAYPQDFTIAAELPTAK